MSDNLLKALAQLKAAGVYTQEEYEAFLRFEKNEIRLGDQELIISAYQKMLEYNRRTKN